MTAIESRVNKTVAGGAADRALSEIASDEFGALHARSEILAWAEQGTYFKAVNPTIGTGIAAAIQTSYSATASGLLVMKNSSAQKKIIPHYIKLICTVAPAAGVSCQAAVAVDVINRYSSGGTALTPKNANTASGASSSVVDVLQFGALVTAGASAERILSRSTVKVQAAPAVTVGDEILFIFGEPLSGGAPGNTNGSATLRIVVPVGPLVLQGQNHSMILHMWNPSNAVTPPSWEVEMGWWER